MRTSYMGSHRNLQLEQLELRLALAGDVLVAVDGAHLAIVGDGQSNQVEMQTVDDAGTLAIVGRADTQLIFDGEPFAPGEPVLLEAFSGITNIELGGGNDRLVMHGVHLGPTFVNTGANADTVVMAGSAFGGPFALDLGTGNDRFIAHHSVFGGPLAVDGGTGDDHVVMGRIAAGAAAIDLGAGEDRMLLADSVFGELAVDMGEDSDILILARSRVAGTAVLSGGADADALVFAGPNHLPELHVASFEFIGHPYQPELAPDAELH